MKKSIERGFSFGGFLLLVIILSILFAVAMPTNCGPTGPRSYVWELILAASSAKTALSEVFKR